MVLGGCDGCGGGDDENAVGLSVNLITPCNQDNTFDGANYMRVTVMGQDIPTPLTSDFEFGAGTAEVPEIPFSKSVQLVYEAFTDDISTASLVARGMSEPFDVGENTADMTINVLMSRVNAFAKTTAVSDGTCSEMANAVEGHAATLLPDGKVLISGGVDVKQSTPFYSDLLTIYDPGTGTFEDVPSQEGKQGGALNFQRAYHTATLVNFGTDKAPVWKVLIVGGLGIIGGVEQSLAEVDVYDVETKSIGEPMSPIKGRAYHTATQLANGDVVFIGGITRQADVGGLVTNEYRNDAEYFQASSQDFRPIEGTMSVARSQHTATYLVFTQNAESGAALIEKIMVAGGRDDKNILGSVEFYDHNAKVFMKIVDASQNDIVMASPRYGHVAERVVVSSTPDSDDPSMVRNTIRIVMAGGFRCIDKCTGSTDCCGSTGGYADLKSSVPNSIEVFNPHLPPAGNFTSTATMNYGRSLMTVSEIPERKLLIAGGMAYKDGKPLVEAEVLAFDEKGVLAKPAKTGNNMADARYSHTATVLMSGMILIVGGHGANGSLATTEFYSHQFAPVVSE
jgi:hypothetical protein